MWITLESSRELKSVGIPILRSWSESWTDESISWPTGAINHLGLRGFNTWQLTFDLNWSTILMTGPRSSQGSTRISVIVLDYLRGQPVNSLTVRGILKGFLAHFKDLLGFCAYLREFWEILTGSLTQLKASFRILDIPDGFLRDSSLIWGIL